MSDPNALYAELKPDVAALADALFELSEQLLVTNGNFLPHGAVLTEESKVRLVAAVPPGSSDRTNSVEVLPVLHDGLRSMASVQCKAVAFAENVTVTPSNRPATAAIKVLLEHKRGLCVALYLPFKKRLFRGFVFGETFVVPAAPEVIPWRS